MDAVLAGLVVPNVQNHSLAALARAATATGFSNSQVPFGGFDDIDAAAHAVAERRPRVFGLSMQATEAALASATLIQVLRRRGYRGVIVAGGHFATLNAQDLLRDVASLDAVVRFGGEAAWVALLRRGLDQDLSRVPGLTFRDASGQPRDGAAPVLDLLPRAFGGDGGEQPVHLGFPAADLVLSRGCEAHCGYCCVAGASDVAERLGSRYERRAVADIGGAIASLYHERGVRVFNFMDDNLLPLDEGGRMTWVRDLGAALRERGVGRIAFSMQVRADACTRELTAALAELGLGRAYVGIDGYSGRQLVALGRNSPADAGPEALANLAAAGVFTVCNALILGPTFAFETVLGEIDALARVRHAPVHLLPIDVRAGSAYFERVRRRGLIEGGSLCQRYRFADPRTALLAEALLGFPTRLEEYSVPVALYDLGYNLGIARRLLPEADVGDAIAIYQDVAERWNRDQLQLLRAAAAAAGSGDRQRVRDLVDAQGARVRRFDDQLRAEVAGALAAVERAASRAHGEPVGAHARGRLLSAVALSVALAACASTEVRTPKDARSDSVTGSIVVDAGTCPDNRTPANALPATDGCRNVQAQVTFDEFGVATAIAQTDGGILAPDVLTCLQGLLASNCYPSYAGTTQTIVSHHFWIA